MPMSNHGHCSESDVQSIFGAHIYTGLASERQGHVPQVPGSLFLETDTKILYAWDGAVWQVVTGGGGGGIPSSTVESETAFGIAAAPGIATTYSRGDHTHGSPVNPIPDHVGS